MKTEIEHTITSLGKGGVILYPTDTVWGIGCDATDKEAVAKVYKVKRREESKSLIILVDSLQMLKTIVTEVPERALEVLSHAEKPTTIIYKNPKGLAENVIAHDNTVAIRIVQNDFCQKLIKNFQKPIVSTSANISGEVTPKAFKEISPAILDAVDYVVNLHHDAVSKYSSRVIKILEDGSVKVLRD
ncbi:MAG: L-threonylcarbamoyladenylate synthase [Flavobacteriaceae bacterium]|nr:L-threonylcarbamoyladenylate synthase [Flavobacteriaceae bacterium]